MKLALQIVALFVAFEGAVIGVAHVADSRRAPSGYERLDAPPCPCEQRPVLRLDSAALVGRYWDGDSFITLEDGSRYVAYAAVSDHGIGYGYGCTNVFWRGSMAGSWWLSESRVQLEDQRLPGDATREFLVTEDLGRPALCESHGVRLWRRE